MPVAFITEASMGFAIAISLITTVYLADSFHPIRGILVAASSDKALAGVAADRSLADMKTLGADAVAINVSWYQDDDQSTEIGPDDVKSASLNSVGHCIDEAHRLGMQVMLKPMVDVRSRIWRGRIQPRDADAWFRSYQTFINTFADLAKRKKVEILCIATEMNTLEGVENEARWRKAIREVRCRYDGKLTYAANWHEGPEAVGGYRAVRFWNALDSIGINPYFPIATTTTPTAEELRAGSRA
ncbi:MAG: hypothetical protein WCJ31_19745 [Planctomycetia bacterium]